MVFNILKGGAAIDVSGRHGFGSRALVDMGVDFDFEGAPGLVDRSRCWVWAIAQTGLTAMAHAMSHARTQLWGLKLDCRIG